MKCFYGERQGKMQKQFNLHLNNIQSRTASRRGSPIFIFVSSHLLLMSLFSINLLIYIIESFIINILR